MRVTRYPCGSRDKTKITPSPTQSFKSGVLEAKQPVVLHRETADRVLTTHFDHLTGGEEQSCRCNELLHTGSESRHQGPFFFSFFLFLKEGSETQLALMSCQLWWRKGTAAGYTAESLRVEMERQQRPRCNHSWQSTR